MKVRPTAAKRLIRIAVTGPIGIEDFIAVMDRQAGEDAWSSGGSTTSSAMTCVPTSADIAASVELQGFIAIIFSTHMPRNDAAAAGQVCPGIRIHAIDIVQSPGIGISPIADMDRTG